MSVCVSILYCVMFSVYNALCFLQRGSCVSFNNNFAILSSIYNVFCVKGKNTRESPRECHTHTSNILQSTSSNRTDEAEHDDVRNTRCTVYTVRTRAYITADLYIRI